MISYWVFWIFMYLLWLIIAFPTSVLIFGSDIYNDTTYNRMLFFSIIVPIILPIIIVIILIDYLTNKAINTKEVWIRNKNNKDSDTLLRGSFKGKDIY